MGDKTAIEWTDATWNPIRGCSRKSPGCGGPNHQGGCYAEKIAARFSDEGMAFHGYAKRTPHGGAWTGKLGLVENALDWPLRWRGAKKPVRGTGQPSLIFVNSMSDLFHENLPEEAIARVFNVMADAPQHTFQVLTKRSDKMRRVLDGPKDHALWSPKLWHRSRLPNVLIGVSVEDQQRADERREDLRAVANQGWRTFVSYEPALGPVNWFGWEFLDWLISGGESGPNARPSHPGWHRAARDFCAEHGIAYFFKQWGEWVPQVGAVDGWGVGDNPEISRFDHRDWEGDHWGEPYRPMWCDELEDDTVSRIGKRRAGALLDGREHKEFPRDE